jgi:hypothetical protein
MAAATDSNKSGIGQFIAVSTRDVNSPWAPK